MKVKVVTIILAALMLMLVMTACGSSGASEQPADVIVETEASAEEPSDQAAEQPAPTEEQPPAEESSDIGAEKVKQIVLAKVQGAVESSIYELERDYDDGRLEYEGSLYHDGYEYEFEIDGATGNILKWEIDD